MFPIPPYAFGNPAAMGGFTPLAYSPVAWYDASQLALANGDPISTLPDLSGNGWNMTASGTARPTFNSTGINSKGTADSDGVDDAMISASIGVLSSWWVLMVVRPISSGSDQVFWAVNDYAPDADYLLITGGSGNEIRLQGDPGTAPAFQTTMTAGSNYAVIVTATPTAGNIYVSNSNTATRAGNYTKNASVMRLFRRGDGFYKACRFGEGVLGSGTLTSGQRTQLFTYANAKWGTAIP